MCGGMIAEYLTFITRLDLKTKRRKNIRFGQGRDAAMREVRRRTVGARQLPGLHDYSASVVFLCGRMRGAASSNRSGEKCYAYQAAARFYHLTRHKISHRWRDRAWLAKTRFQEIGFAGVSASNETELSHGWWRRVRQTSRTAS